ncbi:hypothetical protein DPEC_G00173910, partial [Dallia pectoralis]
DVRKGDRDWRRDCERKEPEERQWEEGHESCEANDWSHDQRPKICLQTRKKEKIAR